MISMKIAFLSTGSSKIHVAHHLRRTKGTLAGSTMLMGKQHQPQQVLVEQRLV